MQVLLLISQPSAVLLPYINKKNMTSVPFSVVLQTEIITSSSFMPLKTNKQETNNRTWLNQSVHGVGRREAELLLAAQTGFISKWGTVKQKLPSNEEETLVSALLLLQSTDIGVSFYKC